MEPAHEKLGDWWEPVMSVHSTEQGAAANQQRCYLYPEPPTPHHHYSIYSGGMPYHYYYISRICLPHNYEHILLLNKVWGGPSVLLLSEQKAQTSSFVIKHTNVVPDPKIYYLNYFHHWLKAHSTLEKNNIKINLYWTHKNHTMIYIIYWLHGFYSLSSAC